MEESNPVPDLPLAREGEFRVTLPAFEGPLDLLLHLIKKHELDILDLPVAFITERYLEYLKFMQELDLDLAGDYLVMAATLAHIKSKMLLPQSPEDQQDDAEGGEEQDPRLDLIRRLLEYQKYKQAAEHLGGRSVSGRDVFGRGMSVEELQGPAPLADIDLFKLLDAFHAILSRAKDRRALEVNAEQITIQERITQITDMLRERRACLFEELFAGDITRYEVVVTFLALLEMTKMRVTRVYQAGPGSPLHVHYALLDADAPTIPPPDEAGAEATPQPMNGMPVQPDESDAGFPGNLAAFEPAQDLGEVADEGPDAHAFADDALDLAEDDAGDDEAGDDTADTDDDDADDDDDDADTADADDDDADDDDDDDDDVDDDAGEEPELT